MSNFLRQLLQRTLAPAASIQPRLASRFESGPAPARFTEERIETEMPAPGTPVPSRLIHSPAFPPASARVADSPPAAASTPITVPAPVAPPAVHASPPVKPAAAANLPAQPPATIPPRAEAASISPPATLVREVFTMPAASSATLLVERVTERNPADPSAPVRAIFSPTAPPPQVPVPAIAPAAPVLIAAPLSPALQPGALPNTAVTAPPTIRVTIGRVDIRAVHSPAAAPARTPAPERRPLVSLEAYLSQRDAK